MKTILVLQFRKIPTDIESEIAVYTRAFEPLPVRLTFKNVFHDDINWSNPAEICDGADALILGGSGDLFFDGGFDTTHDAVTQSCSFACLHAPLFTYIRENHIPTLGICFGHQILAHSAGVRVQNDTQQAKKGSHEVVLTEEGRNDPLFTDIPTQFTAQYGHKDSLSALPQRAVLLAYGEQCAYSAIRLAPQCYSLQFHPELTADDMRKRYTENPEYLPQGIDINHAIRESKEASKILHNFVFSVMQVNATDDFLAEEIEMQEA